MKRKVDAGKFTGPGRSAALATPSVPIPPPELLARAKKLGAIDAGYARLETGVALAAAMPVVEKPAMKRVRRKQARR